MTKRTGKISPLPDGFRPCRNCAGEGHHAFTGIRTKLAMPGRSASLLLVHWCDLGRDLTGPEVFRKGGPDSYADIALIGAEVDEIRETWNSMNS